MLWLKKNSYKEFDNEKKFPRLENLPPAPPPNFSNGPSLRYVINNYSPTAKLIFRLGDYSTILTEPEVNNSFSIFTRSDLSRIRKETIKKTIILIDGWIYAWTRSRKQWMRKS